MKRIYVNVTEEQHDALKARAATTGSTVSEEIRRAVSLELSIPTTADGHFLRRVVVATASRFEEQKAAE